MRVLGFLLCLLLPVEALALSCLRPSVARTFNAVNAAPETYLAVSGRLTFNERKLPKRDLSNQESKKTRIKARLRGVSLGRGGLKVPFDRSITLEVACFGPWCGAAKSGAEVLAFVRRDEGKYTLGVNPCGGHMFAFPKPALFKQLDQCFDGGPCADSRP